ncbi:MAG: nuclear transport factor 2 family protein [Planctomycetes bacterium]|nr:nuclear transport factor 2 family protein [Planctomycetota bacterium]
MNGPREVLFWACFAATGLGMTVVACAEVENATNEETAAVRAAARDYVAAVRRNDTETMLRAWTESGDYVDAAGQVVTAHELIRKHAAAPRRAQSPGHIAMPKSSLRFITRNVAIEDGTYDRGTEDDGGVVTRRFTAVWVKRDGRWLLDSLRESATTSPPRNERLKPLEWLIGEWVGKADDSTMIVSSRWSDGGNYIIREFAILGEGGDVTGTERIGWDSAAGEFKSWIFDSQDGRGEGRWKRDGDRWLVDITEVTADGKKALTSAVVAPKGDGQYVWEVKTSKVGNENIAPRRVTFTRAPEID